VVDVIWYDEDKLKLLWKTCMTEMNYLQREVMTTPYIDAVVADMKGEVMKAIDNSDNFKKWGQKYIRNLIFAHRYKTNTNGLDASLEFYCSNPIQKQLYDKIREEFAD